MKPTLNKLSPITLAEEYGEVLNSKATSEEKKDKGQFFTSSPIANYMAGLVKLIGKDSIRVLDPGSGVGILTAALVERIIDEAVSIDLYVDLFETDTAAIPLLKNTMEYCRAIMNEKGNNFEYKICTSDFIIHHKDLFQKDIFTQDIAFPKYDLVISNPPYFKVNKNHEYAHILSEYIHGQPNVYFMFMAVAERLLLENGQLIFITPRSYCSGSYFERFREVFFDKIDPDHIHSFNSRKGNFGSENILQENIILSGFKRFYREPKLTISSSSISFMNNDYTEEIFNKSLIIDSSDQVNLIRIPINQLEANILELFDQWNNNLSQMNINISTGPVVTFRNKEIIGPYKEQNSYPLLFMKHLKELQVHFPVNQKDVGILKSTKNRSLLLPSKNYILLKRFTSKEQKKRIDCAIYEKEKHPYDYIGVENHLNYIYSIESDITKEELYGISAFLNSSIVDRYFRIINGNTQVNASDIRPLPFPSHRSIVELGKLILEREITYEEVDNWLTNLPDNEEIKTEGENVLGKEQEALEILRLLNLPVKQQNSRSALSLLALLSLKEEDSWSAAKSSLLRIVDIMDFIRENYGVHYAPNTREAIRRQTIHQFERAQIIAKNIDDPTRATNSGKTNYSITPEFLRLAKSYGTDKWGDELSKFQSLFESLSNIYESRRNLNKVPVTLKDGTELMFSPGSHNELQKYIIEEFAAFFARGSQLLYVGDTANKSLFIDNEGLSAIGIDSLSHNKLPDVVLFDKEKNWVFFIEAVTSHGPISPKRKLELLELISSSNVGPIFITAFPDLTVYKKFASDIAWDTEVWFSDNPQHMIHRNGDRFLGPR